MLWRVTTRVLPELALNAHPDIKIQCTLFFGRLYSFSRSLSLCLSLNFSSSIQFVLYTSSLRISDSATRFIHYFFRYFFNFFLYLFLVPFHLTLCSVHILIRSTVIKFCLCFCIFSILFYFSVLMLISAIWFMHSVCMQYRLTMAKHGAIKHQRALCILWHNRSSQIIYLVHIEPRC